MLYLYDMEIIFKADVIACCYNGRCSCHVADGKAICHMAVKIHDKNTWSIHYHQNITGHDTAIENFSIVGTEDQNLIRANKEAIYIRVNNPSLGKNIGKDHLPHIWDAVLINIPELKLK